MKKYFNACKTFKPLDQKLKNSGQSHPALVRKNDLKSPIWNGMEKMKSRKTTTSESFQYEIYNRMLLKGIISVDNIALH